MKFKKIVCLFFVVLLSFSCISFFSGCGEDAANTIRFMGWGGSDEKKAYDAIIADFESKNPGVKVKYDPIPPTQYATKLQNVLNGTAPPDIFYLPGDSVMRYVLAKKVEEITPYIKADSFNMDNVWNNAGWQPFRFDTDTLERGKDDSKLWALPKDVGPFAMYYNKTLFDSKGVTVDKDNPWTWDEFMENIRKIPSGSGIGRTFALASFDPEWHLGSNGAEWLSADKKKVIISEGENGIKFAESIQFLANLIGEDLMPTPTDMGSQNATDYFTSGRAAIVSTGPWAVLGFKNLTFEWDIMPIPKGANGKQSSWRGSMGLALSSASKKKELAYKFMKFCAFDEDGQRRLFEMGQTVPNLKDMAKGEYLTSEKAVPSNRQEFVNMLDDSKGILRASPAEFTYDRDWYEEFFSGWKNVLEGEQTASAYAASKAAQMQQYLDNAWEKSELAQIEFKK